jgi:hypothetical protein
MKFLIYILSVILFTLYQLFMFVVKQLQYIGQSAEWYAARKLFPWQARKARDQYNKEHTEAIEAQLRKINGEKK